MRVRGAPRKRPVPLLSSYVKRIEEVLPHVTFIGINNAHTHQPLMEGQSVLWDSPYDRMVSVGSRVHREEP